MEKVRPWCGQPLDRGWLRNRTEQILHQATARQTVQNINKSVHHPHQLP